ncbi:MAG: aminotransferase class IV [Acidimicrobiia bacterium]
MMLVWVDGVETDRAALPVGDGAVLRGDGCFEVLRVYRGSPFEAAAHLDRLERSARALRLPIPDRWRLEEWVARAAEVGRECAVRVVLTRGAAIPGSDAPPRCLVMVHPMPVGPVAVDLLPVTAPWHPAGAAWELAGAKTLSYAPNLAAGRCAEEQGYHDALLVALEGTVLEGPTFSVAWVVEGKLETPSLDLHVLDSITRRVVLTDARRLGLTVEEGRFPLGRLQGASEVLVLSTVKEVTPVARVGEWTYRSGPVTGRLREAFDLRVVQLTSPQGSVGR